MIKPELSYNFVQVCKEVGDFVEVTYRITNEYNETIQEFAEDEHHARDMFERRHPGVKIVDVVDRGCAF